LVAGLALAFLGASTGIAGADDTSPIVIATVYGPGGAQSSDSVSLAALTSGSQPCPGYPEDSMTEYGRGGPVTTQFSPTDTWSLSSILDCLQTPIPVTEVTGVTIIDSQGAPELGSGSQLTRTDLASPSDFQNTDENPVVQDNGSTVEYDRPWRGGTDQDFDDQVQEAPPLSIEVFEGPKLTVTASASQTIISPGTSVSFTSTVTGPDDTGLSYKWNFDGGAAGSTQADPQVAFASAGVWDVSLEVSDSAGGGGATTIPITVKSVSGTAGQSHSPTGPSKSRGKTRGGVPGKPRTDASQKSSSSNGGGGRGTTSTPAATTSTPAATTSTPAASSSSSSTSTNHKPTGPAHGRAKPSATHPQRGRSPLGATASSEPLVTGRLISDVLPLSAGASPLVHDVPAAAATAPALGHTARASIVPIVATGLVILLLLGLGAGRELRGRRRWRPRAQR
jgi:PKD repeat protein